MFIKAYSLKRTTVQGGAPAKPDAAGDTTAPAPAGPQVKAEEQEHTAIDVIELTILKCKDGSEK
jgi:hypothetical protein